METLTRSILLLVVFSLSFGTAASSAVEPPPTLEVAASSTAGWSKMTGTGFYRSTTHSYSFGEYRFGLVTEYLFDVSNGYHSVRVKQVTVMGTDLETLLPSSTVPGADEFATIQRRSARIPRVVREQMAIDLQTELRTGARDAQTDPYVLKKIESMRGFTRADIAPRSTAKVIYPENPAIQVNGRFLSTLPRDVALFVTSMFNRPLTSELYSRVLARDGGLLGGLAKTSGVFEGPSIVNPVMQKPASAAADYRANPAKDPVWKSVVASASANPKAAATRSATISRLTAASTHRAALAAVSAERATVPTRATVSPRAATPSTLRAGANALSRVMRFPVMDFITILFNPDESLYSRAADGMDCDKVRDAKSSITCDRNFWGTMTTCIYIVNYARMSTGGCRGDLRAWTFYSTDRGEECLTGRHDFHSEADAALQFSKDKCDIPVRTHQSFVHPAVDPNAFWDEKLL